MARRRITVEDDADILVHWSVGRGIRQIARSLGYARNTVRERVAEVTAAGFAFQRYVAERIRASDPSRRTVLATSHDAHDERDGAGACQDTRDDGSEDEDEDKDLELNTDGRHGWVN